MDEPKRLGVFHRRSCVCSAKQRLPATSILDHCLGTFATKFTLCALRRDCHGRSQNLKICPKKSFKRAFGFSAVFLMLLLFCTCQATNSFCRNGNIAIDRKWSQRRRSYFKSSETHETGYRVSGKAMFSSGIHTAPMYRVGCPWR